MHAGLPFSFRCRFMVGRRYFTRSHSHCGFMPFMWFYAWLSVPTSVSWPGEGQVRKQGQPAALYLGSNGAQLSSGQQLLLPCSPHTVALKYMFWCSNYFPTFRYLKLILYNLTLEDTWGDSVLCSGGYNSSELFQRTVSGWDEPRPRNAGFLLYFSTK